nr:glycosyltransferase family A protein [uncultured Bacteroides sp.]
MMNKEYAIVSIVIPCYNQAVFLPETLDSVLLQTYKHWEVIIVNDGSPDDTESIARKYMAMDCRIHYVYQENAGLSAARNNGIEQAQGEFILPLDSDDIIKPEYLEEAMKAFKENPQLKVVYCLGVMFGKINELWDLRYRGYRNLLVRNAFFCSSIFKKSDWRRIGGYDENMRKGYEDWEFFIRLLDEHSLVYQIPQPLFYYRTKETSMTILASRKETAIQIESYMYAKHEKLYTQYYGGILTALRDLTWFKERRERSKNKWYKRLYHKYIKK